jgi:protein-S-isoprenylcysteine O-methyltransferase Ste14
LAAVEPTCCHTLGRFVDCADRRGLCRRHRLNLSPGRECRALARRRARNRAGPQKGLAMEPLVGKVIWLIGAIGWFAIRYPYDRRSRRTPKVRRAGGTREWILMTISSLGLGVLPMIYVTTGAPRFASYPFHPAQAVIGGFLFAVGLWLFHRTHKDLGRNWSVTLEVRDKHTLVTNGVYSRVRHPMYSAFWLWALAQAMLLPNWIAGPAGLVGFGTLFFLRVGAEERLMLETFGDGYRRYMERTARIVPGVY